MWNKNQTAEALSVEEIQAQLAQIEADEEALKAALRERRAADFAAFVDELREKINASGFSFDDVLTRLGKGRRGRSVKPAAGNVVCYVDPENPEHTYTRGRLPGWLREKMEAAGYDPSDKAQRDDFKANHLQLAA